MSIYNDVRVSLSLGDLSMIHCAANCLEFTNEKLEARENRNDDLKVECERQAKEIDQLRTRIEVAETELAAWNTAKNADKPEEAAYAYLQEHNTPFEDKSVDNACEVIRALLSRTQKPANPANPFNNDTEDLI
jgi:hypothetical protein